MRIVGRYFLKIISREMTGALWNRQVSRASTAATMQLTVYLPRVYYVKLASWNLTWSIVTVLNSLQLDLYWYFFTWSLFWEPPTPPKKFDICASRSTFSKFFSPCHFGSSLRTVLTFYKYYSLFRIWNDVLCHLYWHFGWKI